MFCNLFIYLVLFIIGTDVKSSSQITTNQIARSSVSVQTDTDNSMVASMHLLNISSKRVENLNSDQLFILRNFLINSNNFDFNLLDDTSILSTANIHEFCKMCEQLHIVVQQESLFNQGSIESSSSLPTSLRNNRNIENHFDPSFLSNQGRDLVG